MAAAINKYAQEKYFDYMVSKSTWQVVLYYDFSFSQSGPSHCQASFNHQYVLVTALNLWHCNYWDRSSDTRVKGHLHCSKVVGSVSFGCSEYSH